MSRLYDIAAGELPPGDAVKCGNRKDLIKALRRHAYTDLGPDVRRVQTGGTVAEGRVRACMACGKDDFREHG